MTPRVFLQLGLQRQHKELSQLMRSAWLVQKDPIQTKKVLSLYNNLASLLSISPVTDNPETIADRFYFHIGQSSQGINETDFLPPIDSEDKPSDAPFLPICIFLDNLRSAFNVGSIIRTTEALRLGSVHFGKNTPDGNHTKVIKTAMHTIDLVETHNRASLEGLPSPIIGLETSPSAISIEEFLFPSSFTLVLGNEEKGISNESLKKCDYLVSIPLFGFKNSLNVASAFAIAAHAIRAQKASALLQVEDQKNASFPLEESYLP